MIASDSLQETSFMYIGCKDVATDKHDQSHINIALTVDIKATDESSDGQQCDGRESDGLQQQPTSEIEQIFEDGEPVLSNIEDREDSCHNASEIDTQTHEQKCKRKNIFKKLIRKVFKVKKHTKTEQNSDKSGPVTLNSEDCDNPTQKTDVDCKVHATKSKIGRRKNIFKNILRKMFRVQRQTSAKAS